LIARRTLRDFYEQPGHEDARQALLVWAKIVEKAEWTTPANVRSQFRTVDFVNDRAIFNIGGNKYRLIVRINFSKKIVFVRFLGTHVEYDRIEAGRV